MKVRFESDAVRYARELESFYMQGFRVAEIDWYDSSRALRAELAKLRELLGERHEGREEK